MPDLLARGTAVMVGLLLAVAVAALVITSRPPAGANEVDAEFDTAFPLVEGMHVRVDGAPAGSVGTIDVNERGNAVVNLVLNDSIEPPRADASAAVRQQDTTGDSYVAFEPGDAEEPLGEDGIVCTDHDTCPRTLVSPRLDDLINAFGPGEQAGIKLILVETAKALDRRGADLNEAALALRPALSEANEALAEVSSQNDALAELIESAESVTRQAAAEDAELEGVVESLPKLLESTASEAEALDAGLEGLPQTAQQAQSTLGKLNSAATRAVPLAQEMRAGAPQLADAIDQLTPFLSDARSWISEQQPTLELTQDLLIDATPSLAVAKDRVVTGAFDFTGATAELLNTILGGEDAFPALFDDDSYGGEGGTLERRGFGAVAVEPGDQIGYSPQHAPRNWLRVSGVFNCEIFGVPVKPGCLAEVLDSLPGARRKQNAKAGSAAPAADPAPSTEGPAPEPAVPPAQPPAQAPGLPLPKLDLPEVGDLDLTELDLSALSPMLDIPLLDGIGLPGLGLGANRNARREDRRGKGQSVVEDAIGFLLGP